MLVAALVHYCLLVVYPVELHFIGWPITMTAGGIITAISSARRGKTAKVKTWFDRLMMWLWGGFFVSLLLVLGFMPVLSPAHTYPIVIVLYGLGTFVTGGMLRFKPLIFGGIANWAIAVCAIMVDFEWQLLLVALAITVSYIIPGHMLKARA